MVALSAKDIGAFLARPNPAQPIILVFGSDAGLVRERADALIASAVDDVNDPFSLVRLEGDDLAADPARLVDEAMTVPLFGGRRAIRVKAGGRSFASGVEVLIKEPPKDCRIVIEAGELRRDAPLRALCEKAKTAVAIACYPDAARDLPKLIDEELAVAKLRISPDARNALVLLLGGDRLASRNEIRKVALYAHGKAEIALEDVEAVVTDASALAIDPIIDRAFAGRPADVEAAFIRAMAEGINPGTIMFTAQRYAANLHKTRLAIESDQPFESAVERGFPRLHFSRADLVKAALRNLDSQRLFTIIGQLGDAVLDMRKRAPLAQAIAQRALMSIAVNARGTGRR